VDQGGVRQFIQFTARGTIGIRAADGKFMWRDDSAANGTANCCAPVAADGMVVTASGYGKGGSMVELSTTGGETSCLFAWHSQDLTVHHGGLVLYDGHIYATNDQALNCVELKTGKLKWKNRSVGKGSLTFAEGRLVVRSEGGPIALVEATPAEYRELGKFNQPQRSGSPAWTYPVVALGKLFLRDQDKLFVYDVKGK
jgi:outer membrane protein assembly factor BamB